MLDSFDFLLSEAKRLDETAAVRRKTRKRILTRVEEAIQMCAPAHPIQRGHDTMDKLRRYCDSLDRVTGPNPRYRSPNQVLIQNRLSGGIARMVYGPDLLKYEREIIKYNDFTSIRQEIATTMPRRSGKSQSVGEWIACVLLAVHGANIACFSNSGRAAGGETGILGIVRNALFNRLGFPDTKETVLINNDHCIRIVVDGNIRTFNSYPGSCHTLRGTGGNIIVVEEASYVTEEAFKELIIPLMTLSEVCLVMLSTLGAKSSTWFNRLIDSGIVDFHKVEYVCKPCYEKGVRKPCAHNKADMPHWGGEDRVSLMNKMYSDHNQDVFMREVMGIIEDKSEGRVFSQHKLLRIRSAPHVEITRAVHRIFLSIDPCGGSKLADKRTSDWTCLAYCEPGMTLLGGLAIDATRPEHYEDHLFNLVKHIRMNDYMRDTPIHVAVEMSMGFAPSTILNYLMKLFDNIRPCEEPGFARKDGIVTDEFSKKVMVDLMTEIVENEQITFEKNFFTNMESVAKFKEEWLRQMTDFKRIVIPGGTVRARNSVMYTGKGDNMKSRDDLVMATMIGAYVRYQKDFNPEYLRKRHRTS